jgi:hypothetical protein
MGWPSLVVDLHTKGLLTFLDSASVESFDDVCDSIAAKRPHTAQSPFVGYIDVSPLLYHTAVTTMFPSTLEVWTGRFLFGDEFTPNVKMQIINKWAQHFADAIFQLIARVLPVESQRIQELVLFVEKRGPRLADPQSTFPNKSQIDRTAFARSRTYTRSTSSSLSQLLKAVAKYHSINLHTLFGEWSV